MSPPKTYQPPFTITSRAVSLCAEIMRLVGRYEGFQSPKPQPKLRRHNQIRTVLGSLAIEGNTLTIDQVTAVLDNKRVLGANREILEVQNAIETYTRSATFDPSKETDLLLAHRTMMKGLVAEAGRYRSKGVGVFQGSRVAHVAPQAERVPKLVSDLLKFLKKDQATHPLVKSAVVHYELEFIHPFSDGNGRLGRLWQHVILLRHHSVFEFLPIESVIHTRQEEYYRVLRACDQAGSSSLFIEFSLAAIEETLSDFLNALKPEAPSASTRLNAAREFFGAREFSRRDYLARFKTLSTATASRDLRVGVAGGQLKKQGDKSLARYRFRTTAPARCR